MRSKTTTRPREIRMGRKTHYPCRYEILNNEGSVLNLHVKMRTYSAKTEVLR